VQQRFERIAQRVHIGGVDIEKIVTADQRADKKLLVASLEKRLLQTSLSDLQRKALDDFLAPKKQLSDADIQTVIRLIMSTPDYQVT